MDCLDDNQVLAYVEHSLDEAAQKSVAEHLDTCERCLTLTCAVAATLGDSGASGEMAVANEKIAGRYELVEMIGRGAIGGVYVANDPKLARQIAIKIVRTQRFVEPPVRERLAREAKAMAQITHPNVIAVYDTGELDDGVFIAMELVVGQHLAAWSSGKPWREIVRAYIEAGHGLAAAHAAGIIHRDFKPANVMVASNGRVAVGDFGLALAHGDGVVAPETALGDSSLTMTGMVLGTPRYMSAEHFDGEVDARSDQFGFAVALYEALYGAPPFEGATVAELRAAQAKPIAAKPPNPLVPIAIHRAILRGLALDPKKRWPSMGAFVYALEEELRPKSTKWFVAFAFVIAAIVAGGVMLFHKSPTVVTPPPVARPDARISIFVAPFDNQTKDPTLDDTLDLVTGNQLARSTRIDVAASFTLEAAAAAFGGSVTDLDTLVKKIAAADGRVVTIVRGAIRKDGTSYTLVLAGNELANLSRDQLAAATVELANKVRIALGDTAITPNEPMTRSIEALHELVAGQRLEMRNQHQQAADHLHSALQFDSNFAEAHAALGDVLYNAGERTAAVAELDRAVALKDRMGERDRFTLLGDYYGAVGRYTDAIAAYQQLLARWPSDKRTQINVTATALDAQSWPLALDLANNAAHDHPTFAVTRGNLILAELANNHIADATRDGDAMLREIAHPSPFPASAVVIAHALAGETAAAHEALAKLAAIQPDLAVAAGADLAMFERKPEVAEAALRTFLAQHKPTETRSMRLLLALLLDRKGDHAGAAAQAKLVQGDGSVRLEYLAARILVDADQLPDADKLVTSWTGNEVAEWRLYGHVLAGDIALHHGDSATALREYAEAEHHGPSWVIHARRARTGDRERADTELAWCKAHRGEIAMFLTPSLSLTLDR